MPAQEFPITKLLDTLCPMHLVLDRTGHIVHAGPTLRKLDPEGAAPGSRFTELFEIRRPRIDGTMAALREHAGEKLHLQMRRATRADLKAVLVPLPEADGPEAGAIGPRGGAVVNLSFGISVVEAVRAFNLTSADFAATDLTIEMLYLMEAKTAAMEASRTLNLRLQGAMIAAEEKAYTDQLTGLKNRRAAIYLLERLIDSEQDFALMHVDLDFFKAVNDTMGHAAGDHVLREVGRIMAEETRSQDTVARIGGDEFLLIFVRLTDCGRVQDIAKRLIARLEQPIIFNEQVCRISASAGSVLSRDYPYPTLERMMEDADIALYAAKEGGRGQHKAFVPEMRTGNRMARPSVAPDRRSKE